MSSMLSKATILGGSAMLVGAGVLGALPVVSDGGATVDVAIASETASGSTGSALTAVEHVQGLFSFNQDARSSTSSIVNTFNKAATVLCASLPDYGMRDAGGVVEVSNGAGSGFSATVEEMAKEEGSQSFVMACACASNIAGGGAIANAEVEGVSLESVAALAQAR